METLHFGVCSALINMHSLLTCLFLWVEKVDDSIVSVCQVKFGSMYVFFKLRLYREKNCEFGDFVMRTAGILIWSLDRDDSGS